MKLSFAPLRADAVELLSWATDIDYSRSDFAHPRWLCVTARRADDRLMGVAVFELKTWFDAYFSIAIVDPRCASRRVLRVMFDTVFRQAVRVTAEVDPGNEHALRQVRRMGFVYEGFKRLGVEGRRDALMFGMLREDCRYLPGYTGPTVTPLALGGQHGVHTESA